MTSLEQPRHGTIVESPTGSIAMRRWCHRRPRIQSLLFSLRRRGPQAGAGWILDRGPLAHSAGVRGKVLRLQELLARARLEPIRVTRVTVGRNRRAAELLDAVLHRVLHRIHDLQDPGLLTITRAQDLAGGLGCCGGLSQKESPPGRGVPCSLRSPELLSHRSLADRLSWSRRMLSRAG